MKTMIPAQTVEDAVQRIVTAHPTWTFENVMADLVIGEYDFAGTDTPEGLRNAAAKAYAMIGL